MFQTMFQASDAAAIPQTSLDQYQGVHGSSAPATDTESGLSPDRINASLSSAQYERLEAQRARDSSIQGYKGQSEFVCHYLEQLLQGGEGFVPVLECGVACPCVLQLASGLGQSRSQAGREIILVCQVLNVAVDKAVTWCIYAGNTLLLTCSALSFKKELVVPVHGS